MSDILGSKLFNGVDTAWLMNKLKVDDGKLILYNRENPEFSSSVDVEDLAMPDDRGETRDRVYYASNYITPTQAGSDCTTPFQNLIQMVYEDGGGVIKLDGRIYKVRALYILPGVYIDGCGWGNSIIERILETEPGKSYEENTDDSSSGYGFITIPTSASSFGLSNLTLSGNCTHNLDTVEGIDYVETTDNYRVHGLFVEDCDSDVSYTNETEPVIDTDTLYSRPSIPTENECRTFKYGKIENVAIIGFSGCGVYIGMYNFNLSFNNVQVQYNIEDGIYNLSKGNYFNNLFVEFNGKYGIYNDGQGNKWNGIKCFWNGMRDHNAFGFYSNASKNQINMIEISDNWCNGVGIRGDNVIMNNALIDTNGYRSRYSTEGKSMTPRDCALLVIDGCEKGIFQATLTTHRSTVTARIPMEVTNNARYNSIDVTQEYNVAYNKSQINGSAMTSNIINATLSDNIVRYIQS